MSNRTVMGFDFGTKSIGAAIGQEITGTARPLASFKAKDGIPDWAQIEKNHKKSGNLISWLSVYLLIWMAPNS